MSLIRQLLDLVCGRRPESGAPKKVDVVAKLDGMQAGAPQRLDWRHSVVDLMKLLSLDSSLPSRQQLARELHYSGDLNDDSKAMNEYLHREIMHKLNENGGNVPKELT